MNVPPHDWAPLKTTPSKGPLLPTQAPSRCCKIQAPKCVTKLGDLSHCVLSFNPLKAAVRHHHAKSGNVLPAAGACDCKGLVRSTGLGHQYINMHNSRRGDYHSECWILWEYFEGQGETCMHLDQSILLNNHCSCCCFWSMHLSLSPFLWTSWWHIWCDAWIRVQMINWEFSEDRKRLKWRICWFCCYFWILALQMQWIAPVSSSELCHCGKHFYLSEWISKYMNNGAMSCWIHVN